MAEHTNRMSRAPRLVEPAETVLPLLYVVSRDADNVNGWRFDANLWDASLPPPEAARRAGRPAGFEMHPATDLTGAGRDASAQPAGRYLSVITLETFTDLLISLFASIQLAKLCHDFGLIWPNP